MGTNGIDCNETKIEKEFEISIDLENFSYSNTKNDTDKKKEEKWRVADFFGRVDEKARLLDHLKQEKDPSRSFLIAGYRGVGKTTFVTEVISEYKSSLKPSENKEVIDIYINLGNDGDLSSKSVLFNMVSSLSEKIDGRTTRLTQFLFHSFIPKLLLAIIFCSLLLGFILDLFELTSEFKELFYIRAVDYSGFAFFCISLTFFIIGWVFVRDEIPLGSTNRGVLLELQSLQKEIYSTTDNNIQIKSNFFNFGRKIVTSPLNTNQIESRLILILKKLENIEVIYVFDELDKLSGITPDKKEVNIDLIKESKLRKQQVDSILGDLKNLITTSFQARYIFIAGRDMYDAYLSERGSSNSLYESLFNDHIYIPSLLTDRSNGEVYLLDSMIEAFVVSKLMSIADITTVIEEKINKCIAKRKKENSGEKDVKKEEDNNYRKECERKIDLSYLKLSDYKTYRKPKINDEILSATEGLTKEEIEKQVENRLLKEIYILKTLIHFLTLHSWGNCKRLFTLFESFVRKNSKGSNALRFLTQDIQRLVLSSQLYILFHHSLSRMLMNADDKLVVSSFSVFHYILKYHGIGFSREHILRMYETINIHSSPELTRIVDIIIHNVLLNHVRRIRNSFYQYRFTFLHEKEIHFITTINDGESAAFNFSLNAMDAVKQHYKNLIVESKHTHADERYGHTTLASIHVIVGNFHFWEQSYDEASIHYSIALDMLEKNGGLTKDPIQVDLVLQMVEILLKQGSAAERVGDYSTAAAIYLNAEVIANNCLGNINVDNKDSKWDILRQPRWAKLFLNLKQSAIHYKEHTYLISGEVETDVSIYRKAVLSFFMDNFSTAYSGFMAVTNFSNRNQNSERAYFLKGNAYLKAGLSLLLNYSSTLHNNLEIKLNHVKKHELRANEKAPFGTLLLALIESVDIASQGIEDFALLGELDTKNEQMIPVEANDQGEMYQVIRLINLAALSFENGKLYFNAAMSYLSMVMVWEAFLEVLPWKKNEDEYWNGMISLETETVEKYIAIQNRIKETRKKPINWIFQAQQKAFDCIGHNTGEAYHHFMKSVLERNLGKNHIDKECFFGMKEQRDRILTNKDLMYQHYSLFGQVIAASIYWEEIAADNMIAIDKTNVEESLSNLLDPYETENPLLPYGIKHYSMMLWLKGRMYLDKLLNDSNKESSDSERFSTAANAIINLFRSSQYVIKTHGEASNMILPPLFIIYYNMWEVLFHLVHQEYKKKPEPKPKQNEPISFEQAVYDVRFKLGEKLKDNDIKDVSSRVLDLLAVSQMAKEQYRIVELIGDLSSSNRTGILRNKYYLDDDYEDSMFILDWSYCRFFSPSAMVHGKIIEYKMESLEGKFKKISRGI